MVKRSLQSGVTLIEMLVVVGIIAVVSSVIIFNYSDFSTNVSLRNLVQDVALTVRKAQTYATSVRTIDGVAGSISSRTYPAYGISFSLDRRGGDVIVIGPNADTTSPSSKRFVLFADIPADGGALDGLYRQDAVTPCGTLSFGNECIETFDITTADRIVGICVGDNDTSTADDPYNCPTRVGVDITYRRPSPDALIMAHDSTGSRQVSYAKIVFESAKGLRRAVLIWNTGQVSVQ